MSAAGELLVALLFAVLMVVGILHAQLVLEHRKLKRRIEISKTSSRWIAKGDWIRFLVAQPTLRVKIGDLAQVREVVIGDDVAYVIRIDTDRGQIYTTLTHHEAWMFELVPLAQIP